MNQQQTRAGGKPAAGVPASEHKYETAKGCLTLVAAVLGFLIVSVVAAYLTGMKPGA